MKKFGDIRQFFKRKDNIVDDLRDVPDVPVDVQQNENDLAGTAELLLIDPSKASGSKCSNEPPSDLGTLDTKPVQPVLDKYPLTKYNSQNRSFSSKYFKDYDWLEYSIKCNAVFCYYCRLFGSKAAKVTNETADIVFTVSGFNNWGKLKERLQKHGVTVNHLKNAQKYSAFQQTKKQGSVTSQISSAHRDFIKKNQEYFKTMTDIVLTLSCQGIALRGHNESDSSSNKGNLKEICELFSRHNISFSESYNKYFNLSSSDIQNEIIAICSNLVQKKIVCDVRDCGMFSIMVDEARSFKQEQLSLCVRYVNTNLEIQEHFLGFFECSNKRDATSLCDLMIENIRKLGLGNIQIVGQSYDGASVMSGRIGGVQAKLREVYPEAIYIHCMAHRLNLAVVDTCSNIEGVQAFFNTLEALYVHFSQPSLHEKYIDLQKKMKLRVTELTRLSDTRWNCRAENCEGVKKNYTSIIQLLKEEVSQNANKNVVEAVGLLNCITTMKFLSHLYVLTDVLNVINILSKKLQSKEGTLAESSNVINGVIKTFEEKRSDRVFSSLWKEIEVTATSNNIDIESTRNSKRKRTESKLLKDFVVVSTIGSSTSDLASSTDDNSKSDAESLTLKDTFRINIYYSILDSITGHLKIRFSPESQKMAMAVDNFFKFDLEGSSNFVNHYSATFGINRDVLKAEMLILKNIVMNNKGPTSAINEDCIKKVLNQQDTFSNYYKLFKVAVILPVNSASCERSFSAMRRIRNWLRSTMSQNRFSDLSILNIENELARSIDHHDVLQEFTSNRQNQNKKMPLVF